MAVAGYTDSETEDTAGTDTVESDEPTETYAYENLTYEIDDVGRDLLEVSGHGVYLEREYQLTGHLTVGPEDCYTSDIESVEVTADRLEVTVTPVELEDRPTECTGDVVEHEFTVALEITEVHPDRYVLVVDDYEDGLVTVHDTADDE